MDSDAELKRTLLDRHREALLAARASLEAGTDAARAGTRVDGVHRPASRGERAAVTSEGYLARGLGERLAELAEHLRILGEVDAGPRTLVSNGALVTLRDEHDGEHRLFVVPGGDGARHDGVTLVSPTSPWVAPFLGVDEGEVADVVVRARRIEVELVRVR
ncbi:MAG: hypothetical protein AAF602_10890 [Myxococcota bacterium]